MQLLTSGQEWVEYPFPRSEDEYKIVFKFFPNPMREGDERFLIAATDKKGGVHNCWVPEEHFSDLEIGDILCLPGAHHEGQWVEFTPDYQVRRVYVPLDETIEALHFVSLPVFIGREAYYVCRQPSHWTVIPYTVARDYYERGDFTTIQVDYYRALGVTQGASSEWIRSSYRRLARRYHPDRAPAGREREYANRMCVLNEAYSVLSDEQRRAQYDQRHSMPASLKRWPGGGPGTLTALIEKRGSWWIVRKILRFQRRTRESSFTVPVVDVVFGQGEVHIPIRLGDDQTQAFVCVQENTFPVSHEMNHTKEWVSGQVTLILDEAQRAEWNEGSGEPEYHWVTTTVRLVWPDDLVEEFVRLAETQMVEVT